MASLALSAPATDRPCLLRLARLSVWLVVGIVLLLQYLPILMITLLSLFKVRRGQFQWDTFSLDAFAQIPGNAQLMAALGNSLLVAAIASIVAVALSTALALYNLSRPGRATRLLEFLIYLPFVLPPIVTGLTLLITFRQTGIERGLSAVTIGHVAFVFAIAYNTISARLKALSPTLSHASMDLGATRAQTLYHIVLPQLASGLATAGILAFALSLDETMISIFLVGDTTTLPIRLYSLMRVGFSPEVNALVTVILAVTIAIAFAMQANLRGTSRTNR